MSGISAIFTGRSPLKKNRVGWVYPYVLIGKSKSGDDGWTHDLVEGLHRHPRTMFYSVEVITRCLLRAKSMSFCNQEGLIHV